MSKDLERSLTTVGGLEEEGVGTKRLTLVVPWQGLLRIILRKDFLMNQVSLKEPQFFLKSKV